ncbi:MAG: DUF3047 domain-containing protein [Candidatus Rokubacteria bacterium]|nr:DUF3047 domain-containing protein [Candidatus Rokubacteria bacterium]
MRFALALLAALAVTTVAWADVVVEDWSKIAAGTKGIPPGWKGQQWGSPAYDMTVVDDGGRKVLHLRSKDEGSTISKEVKGKVDLKETPILEWSWKMVTLPKGGNSCVKATDDQAGQVFVMWPRFPEQVRSRIIGYVWDTTRPVGTSCKSEKTSMVHYIVVRSGMGDAGKWVTERRNVREDFRKVYGEEAENPGAVSVSIDSNDTHSFSEAFVGPIFFRKPSPG